MAKTTITLPSFGLTDPGKDQSIMWDDSASALTVTGQDPTPDVDQWRLTTNFTASDTNANNITSNLERVDTGGQGKIGTGMTESSGKFTFPTTGFYLVRGFAEFELNGDSRYNVLGIRLTTDNSSYNGVATGNVFIQQTASAATANHAIAETLVDCTNTTNVNIFFYTQIANGATVNGSSSTSKTYFTFQRLGDT
jgi:hypothetical protein